MRKMTPGNAFTYPRLRRTRTLTRPSWAGRRVLVVGAARQGTAMARFWARRGAQVILNDRRPLEELEEARQALADLPITWAAGTHSLALLEGVAAVGVSGGVPLSLPLLQEARRRGLPLYSDAHLFLEEAVCPVVAITGSSGKTTTTTLLGRMARAAAQEEALVPHLPKRFRRVWVLGNIGPPLLDFVDALQPEDVAVVELSSFQLDLVRVSPEVGVVLNITPNHLDRHGTMEAYIQAKAHMVAHQGPDDWAVLGHEEPNAWKLRHQTKARVAAFGLTSPPAPVPAVFVQQNRFVLRDAMGRAHELFSTDQVHLPGQHNLQNVAAAALAAALMGLEREHMEAGLDGFTGVPHRLELVLEHQGVAWYNDSIATTPERAMAALRAFAGRPIILLAGGKDKNLPWDAWARLVRREVEHLLVFGPAQHKILTALDAVPGDRPRTVKVFPRLRPAVEEAARLAQPGSVVLLSPGATSFDEFQSFEVRGEHFRAWVKEITGGAG